MSIVQIQPVSFSNETAAIATGLSVDILKKAVRTGDLVPRYVRVDGRVIAKPVFERAELERFVRDGVTVRPRGVTVGTLP